VCVFKKAEFFLFVLAGYLNAKSASEIGFVKVRRDIAHDSEPSLLALATFGGVT
jgi:hypothetical protein